LADDALGSIDPDGLRAWLNDGQETALLDAREQEDFSLRNLFHATCLPLGRLELLAPRLLPRRDVRIVLTDAGEGLAERAAGRLVRFGYGNVHLLAGGVDAWEAAGLPVYAGVHVPSKAFAEVIEHERGTPWIDVDELAALRERGEAVTVLDSRPFREFNAQSIPGALNLPGAELVWRFREAVPSADTLVVVNCGGRTRSIVGAQTLIEAGVPNRVVSLKDGTMAWHLSGRQVDRGAERRLARPGPPDDWSVEAAAAVARRFGVATLDRAGLARWRAETDRRTLYIVDVRPPEEYADGHLADAISVPGGQLVQETEEHLAVRGARVLLVDDGSMVRARTTAAWLRQMGWREVAVLAEGPGNEALAVGPEPTRALGLQALPRPEPLVDAHAAHALVEAGAAVVDLSRSTAYKQSHISGAWFAIRARLGLSLPAKVPPGPLLLTSEDGLLARLAAPEAAALGGYRVHVLAGGNAAWRAAGHPLTPAEPRWADAADDVWLAPRDRPDTEAAMRRYLAWELDLDRQIRADPDVGFRLSPHEHEVAS